MPTTARFVPFLAVAALAGGCMNGPTNGAVFTDGTTTTTQQVSFYGFHTQSNHKVRIQILTPATADPAVDTNWKDVPGSPVLTGTTAYTYNDPTPMFLWQLNNVVIAPNTSVWPRGGVARVRAQAITTNGANPPTIDANLRVFDDDFDSCKNENSSKSWSEIRDICGTRYGNRNVANLVSAHTTPSATLANVATSPYLARPGGAGASQSTGLNYYVVNNAFLLYPNLPAFKAFYGFGMGNPTEVGAVYYNGADLGLGREMHCLVKNGITRVCYVTNYADRDPNDQNKRIFAGSDANVQSALSKAINGFTHPNDPTAGDPVATVAMVETTGQPILFLVFGADGALTPNAVLDRSAHPNTEVPKNCMSCHATSGSFANNTVNGAHFLPFDLDLFQYSGQQGFRLTDQLQSFRKLNAIVQGTSQTTVAQQLLNGWYPPNGPANTNDATFHGDFMPTAWQAAGATGANKVYAGVVKPYCRTCHLTNNSFDWSTPTSFSGAGGLIQNQACDGQGNLMPHALVTQDNFWKSPARAHVLGFLGITGDACDP